jgi:hypothetical protein
VLGLAAVSLAGWVIRSSVRKRAGERGETERRPGSDSTGEPTEP